MPVQTRTKYRYIQELALSSVGSPEDKERRGHSDLSRSPEPHPLAQDMADPEESMDSANTETDIISEDEDDRLLEEKKNISSQETESQAHRRDDKETPKDLLGLRQLYKKVTCNLAKAESHVDFIAQCLEQHKTPKGLRVNVTCNALLPKLTNVEDRFKRTTHQAEKAYKDHLLDHYPNLKLTLLNDQKRIQQAMDKTLSTLSDKDERQKHLDLMKKTEENVKKHKKTLDNTKKRKL